MSPHVLLLLLLLLLACHPCAERPLAAGTPVRPRSRQSRVLGLVRVCALLTHVAPMLKLAWPAKGSTFFCCWKRDMKD